MSWRHKRSFLHLIQQTQFLKSSKLRHFSVCVHLPYKTHQLLTPQIVLTTLSNCNSDLITLSFFIWCAKQHNYFHDSQAFNYMVSIVDRLTKRYISVSAIVKELESLGLVVKAQTFLLLLRIYWRGEMYSMVFDTFEHMVRFGFEPNTFAHNVVMDVLFRSGQIDAGIRVLKNMKLPNFLSYNIALSNLCKLNDLVNAKDVLVIMLRAGYYPNVETFEMLLYCCCKSGQLVEVFQLLGMMITLGVSLSVNALNILLDGVFRFGRPDMASHLLESMVESSCTPNVVTYTILFKGFIESKMISRAFGVLDTMQSKGCTPDIFLCNILIDALSKIGRYDDAIDVFLSLSKWNLVPDSYTFSSLLSSLCFSGKFNLLPKLLSGFDIEADLVVCNSLLNYFCKSGFPHHAVELYDYMTDKGIIPDNYSFVGLLKGLFGENRVDDAVNVYLGAVMYYSNLDAHVHSVVIDGLIRNGRCHQAFRLFRTAIEEKYQLDDVSYSVAICGLVRSGKTADAFAFYAQMKDAGLYPNAHTYNLLLCGFCAERNVRMVKVLLQEIIKGGVQINNNTFIKLINFLFKSYLWSSPFKQSINLWNMGLVPLPPEALNVLLSGELNYNINFGNANLSTTKNLLEDNIIEYSSSSDDLPELAASVG